MDDNQQWHVAWAKLDAMKKHPPTSWDELAVSDYNRVLASLEAAAPGEDLSGFRVAEEEMKPKAVSFRRGGYSGTPGSVTMGKKRYADTQGMLQRLDAVTSYFNNRQPAPEAEASRPIGFR